MSIARRILKNNVVRANLKQLELDVTKGNNTYKYNYEHVFNTITVDAGLAGENGDDLEDAKKKAYELVRERLNIMGITVDKMENYKGKGGRSSSRKTMTNKRKSKRCGKRKTKRRLQRRKY